MTVFAPARRILDEAMDPEYQQQHADKHLNGDKSHNRIADGDNIAVAQCAHGDDGKIQTFNKTKAAGLAVDNKVCTVTELVS